jgi:hypothetical protein
VFAFLTDRISLAASLSLFFITLLLLPEAPTFQKKNPYDPRWAFYGLIQIIFSFIPMALLFLTPQFPSAVPLLQFQRRWLPLLRTVFLVAAPTLAPKLLGRVYPSVRAARRSYVPLFSLTATLSTAMYLIQILLAVSDSLPKTSHHWNWGRPSRVSETQTFLQRTGHAALRVINVPSAHPAIAEIAWDNFLTLVALSLWTAIRGIDIIPIAKHTLAPWLRLADASDRPATTSAKPKAPVGRRARTSSASANTATANSSAKTKDDAPATSTKRKSTVREQRRKPSVIRVEIPSDEEEEDNYGGKLDVRNIISDPETPAGSSRRSMRARKPSTRSPEPEAAPVEPEHGDANAKEDDDDKAAFVPTPATKRDVDKLVPAPEHGSSTHAVGEDVAAGESVAVSWGLAIVGGLGTMAAGILGADI